MLDVNQALLISGIITIFYQLFFFAIAASFKFDKVFFSLVLYLMFSSLYRSQTSLEGRISRS